MKPLFTLNPVSWDYIYQEWYVPTFSYSKKKPKEVQNAMQTPSLYLHHQQTNDIR